MKILVIGSGGREHSLVWKLSKSDLVEKIYTAPGNGGTAVEAKNKNLPIKATELEKLADFASVEKIDLTIVGPEDPLSLGIVDLFEAKGLKIFGPSAKAARLESSKIFAKRFMKDKGIPTPAFKIFDDYPAAYAAVKNEKPPIVLKADGLALGKGVKICTSAIEACEELESMMLKSSLGDAAKSVILDQFIDGGFEVSFLALADGKTLLPLATSQDNKRLCANDKGPNTGGMGVVSPIPQVDPKTEKGIIDTIMQKTIDGMKSDGIPYKGVLYAGLIFDGSKPLVLEYNARFGDPETQPLLFRMKSDIVPPLYAAATGDISGQVIEWDEKFSVCIVMASKGYPGEYKKGLPITGLEKLKKTEDTMIFHAGTSYQDGRYFTNGGRVLGICAKDNDLAKAKAKALELAEKIRFEGAQYRKDIGDKILTKRSL
jgi:phosphoribosylamine---glycine ligase